MKNRDYPNFEHIVIDDGSQDDGKTAANLKRFNHLKRWNRENKGQYATMNEGLIAAKVNLFASLIQMTSWLKMLSV